MKLFLLLLISSIAVSASFVAVYDSNNATITNLSSFKFRQLTVVDVSISGFYNALQFTSIAVDKNLTQATADAIHGAAYAGFGNPPSVYLAYFLLAANWNGGNNPTTSSMTLSDAFVALVYTKVDEITANGTVVQTINFGSLGWSVTAANLAGNLISWTVTGSQNTGFNNNKASNFSVNVTFVLSTQLGVLVAPGSPIITPKSLETVIEFVNFPYLNKLNRVALGIITGSAAASVVEMNGVTHFIAGNGTGATFITLQHVATVDGATVPVQISNWTTGVTNQNMNNNNMAQQVNDKYGAASEFRAYAVIFPAGANHVLYDPASGVGSYPPDTTGTTPTPGSPGTPGAPGGPGGPPLGGSASSLVPLFAFALALLFLL